MIHSSETEVADNAVFRETPLMWGVKTPLGRWHYTMGEAIAEACRCPFLCLES
jgi:hypothetical protein